MFQTEFDKFCEELAQDTKNKSRLRFLSRIKDANGALEPIDVVKSVECSLKGGSGSLRRIHGCLRVVCEPLKDYTRVIDTLVSSYPFPTALIWGGLKIVVECSGRYGAQFDIIKKEIQELPDYLWELSGFDELYASSAYGKPVVQNLLSRSYRLIFEFWYRCTDILEHQVRSALTHNQKLDDVVQNLRDNSQKLVRIRAAIESQLSSEDRLTLANEAALNAAMRNSFLEERIEAASERAAATFERELAEKERELAAQERRLATDERHRAEQERLEAELEREKASLHREDDALFKQFVWNEQKWETMRARIDSDNDLNFGTFGTANENRQQGTCQWLLESQEFGAWIGSDAERPVLWLNGKHGAGKTVLCAAAIDYCRNKLHPAPAYAFQFFSKDHVVLKNQLLRNIAGQLLSCTRSATTEFPQSLESFLTMDKGDSLAVEALVRTLLSELPVIYLFFDGLDEVEYTDDPDNRSRSTHNEAPKQIVQLFIKEAQKTPKKLRLWCSSQPLTYIHQYMLNHEWEEHVQQLSLETHHTEEDIRNFLTSAIATLPEADQAAFTQIFTESARGELIEGSFLWVHTMLEDLKERADDNADLFRLARAGLPTTMSEGYNRIISRLKRRQAVKADGVQLWRLVLSLVTFAKRPLRVGEIIEAIATYRTKNGENMDHTRLTTPDKVISCCLSLVSLVRSDNNDSESKKPRDEHQSLMRAHLRLSHSAVQAFLLKHSNHACSLRDDKAIVSTCIIRDCCFQYLGQPKYEQLLCGTTVHEMRTSTDEKLRDQWLLPYAAKYWFQHFDSEWIGGGRKLERTGEETDEKSIQKQALGFIRSANFQTCLQIQCLLVEGHFLLSFDRITDEPRCLRRTLPDWVQTADATLQRQYNDFQSEWHLPLKFGISLRQIERCFWQGHGATSMFADYVSRHQNFQFEFDESQGTLHGRSQIMSCSSDGQHLFTLSIANRRDDPSLHLHRWVLNGRDRPKLAEQLKLAVTVKYVDLNDYWLPSTRLYSAHRLVPSLECLPPLAAASINAEKLPIRIGSRLLARRVNSDGTFMYELIENADIGRSWDDTACKGQYLALCRRRQPKPRRQCTAKERRKEKRRKQRQAKMMLDAYQKSKIGYNDLPEGFIKTYWQNAGENSGDSDDSDSNGSANEHLGDEASSLDLSLAEESWSEGSDSESSSEQSILSHNPNYDTPDEGLPESDDDINLTTDEEDDIESTASIDACSEDGSDALLSAMTDASYLQPTDDSDVEVEETGPKDQEDWAKALARRPTLKDEPCGHVEILDLDTYITCDGCGKHPLRVHFRCIVCVAPSSFDLCLGCEKRGRWCKNLQHQLYKIEDERPVDLKSRQNVKIRQELAVYCMEEGKEGHVFHAKKNYKAFLYDSPPVFHPHHPLVVWPLSGTLFLFADYRRNSYLEPKLRTAGPVKSQTICVNMSFSPCGALLRVASINATMHKDIVTRTPTSAGSVKLTAFLNLNIAVLRLSASRPTRSPPKMVASASYRLGPCVRPVVQQFPFAFTWRAEHLYLTMSDSRLRVFRVAFPDPKTQTNAANGPPEGEPPNGPEISITTPKETIFLPRSSRNRTVQFFPPREAGTSATVIIGPRYGARPAPPIGVYLKEEDLGGWIPLEDGDTGQTSRQRMKLEGQLENFCADEDCDIIPFE